MQGEDFNLSGLNLTWPKAIQRTKRFLKIILGFTLLTTGAAMLMLPGPGWLTIGLGLVVLAAEFIWAQRLLNRLRGQAIKLCGLASGGTDPKEPSGSCLDARTAPTPPRREPPQNEAAPTRSYARTRH